MKSSNKNNNYHSLNRLVNKKIIEGNINEFVKHEKYSVWKTNIDDEPTCVIELIRQKDIPYLNRVDMILLLICLILMFYVGLFGIYTGIEYNREIVRKKRMNAGRYKFPEI